MVRPVRVKGERSVVAIWVMPGWAQWVGSALPLTHYLRVVRGIVLKGNGFFDIAPSLWPICLFLLVSLGIGLLRYRQTLD